MPGKYGHSTGCQLLTMRLLENLVLIHKPLRYAPLSAAHSKEEMTYTEHAARNGPQKRDMMSLWKSEISIRSVLNRRPRNIHVHGASEGISTRCAGCDGRRKTACRPALTSGTARFTLNYEITSSEWMMM